ncbi:hypothetical protein [Pseudarthrobacter sulfonivorans]|uniref:hypothetical protein n=1 Tax=Pseudarthrobacter sulfonivorans TaxID=121292 RepID=UPI002105305F|nr:hypothetical protein [Pseudarthrobacter sulfonivorans]
MRDESYEAGYRAGHLQGWIDAVAKLQAQGEPDAALRRPPGTAPTEPIPTWPIPGERTTTARAGVPAPAPVPAVAVPVSLVPPSPLTVQAPVAAPGAAQSRAAAMVRPPALAQGSPPLPPQSPAAAFRDYPESPAERQMRREKRDRQNINITLYVASLLLVAAAALFIGTSLPPMMRFAGVVTVTALFYGAGFVLHSRVPRLRPAAVAFSGTGLALVPVTGLALYNFALPNGPTAWLLTSLVGTVAYVAAAVRLESRVLVYLSLTFLASTAFSGVSVLGGALVWYFASLIGVAAVLTVLALARPGWLPPVYVRPLMVLHPYVVPAVAAAATCVPLYLTKAEYALIIALCGVYFALMAVVAGPWRLRNFHAARAALTVAASVAVWNWTGRGSDALLTVSVLLAVQALGLAFYSARLTVAFAETKISGQGTDVPRAADQGDPAGADSGARSGASNGAAGTRWQTDALVTFGLQLAATVAFGVAREIASFVQGFVSRTLADTELAVPLWIPVACALGTGLVLAARWRGRTEWAPVAALAMAGLASGPMGMWPLAAMLFLASGYWAARAAFSAGVTRGRHVLGARVALTLAVPVTVAAVVGHGPERDEAFAFALLLALVCQQLLTAILQRSGVPAFAPQATLGALSTAGALVLMGLPFLEPSSDHALTAAALFIQLIAAIAVGAITLPRPAVEKDWSKSMWEAVPLGMAVVAVTVAFQAVSQTAANVALVLVVAYLVITAMRLPLRLHRWAYWWLARAASTVLVLTSFHQLQRDDGPVVIADEVVRPATILVTALALQLCLPLLAAIRRRAPRGIAADAAAVVLLQLVAAATLAQAGSAEWQHTVAAVLAAVGAAASGYFLRREAGAVWLAPFTLGALLAVSHGSLLTVELSLGIFAVYATLMVVAEPQRAWKGWYFVAARVLTAGLALALSYDLTASATAVSVTFALVLAAQHVIRWMMRARLAEVPFQQAAVWITLAGQTILPLVYVAGQRSAGLSGQHGDGGRWVVLFELLLLLVAAAVARRLFNARGALYFAVYAAVFGVLALGPLITFGGTFLVAAVLSHTGTAAVLLAVALMAVAAGIVRRRRNQDAGGVEHWLWLATAGSFAGVGLLISSLGDGWVPGAAVLVLAVVLFAASHVEDWAVLHPLAVLATQWGAIALATEVLPKATGAWGGFLPWLVGAGSASVALYAVRLIRADALDARRLDAGRLDDSGAGRLDAARVETARTAGDPVRRWSLAGGAFLGLVLVAMAGVRHDATSWTAAAVLAAAVGIAYREAPGKARRVALEVGALVLTAAAQRAAIFDFDAPGRLTGRTLGGLPDPFWVAQWYVALGAVLGGLRYVSGHQRAGRLLVGVAAGLLSLGGLGVVFSGSGAQQLWVLVLLALLLVAGLVVGERLFVWWGAAGVAVCILWAMRHYTFLLLALIAVGLIAFALWRLNRGPAGQSGPAPGEAPGPEAGPQVMAGPWPGHANEQSAADGGLPVEAAEQPEAADSVASRERSTSWDG